MRRIILTALALVAVHAAQAQALDERKIAEAARALQQAWQQTISSGKWYVADCANNTYRMFRFVPASRVTVDVRRTDSLMAPYVLTILVDGNWQYNSESPHADGFRQDYAPKIMACFKTPAGARAALGPEDIVERSKGTLRDFTMHYTLEPGTLRFVSAPNVSDSEQRYIMQPVNAADWGHLVTWKVGR